MDVVVRLSLQGGHKWEFCCQEDDPIIFGLMSALPGADLGGNLPADGLIQLETRTGERLFLTRSSLVSISIVPVTDQSQLLHGNFLATSVKVQTEASRPASFVMVADALPTEVHRALTDQTVAYAAPTQDQGTSKIRELGLGTLREPVAKALQFHLDRSLAQLGISESPEMRLELGLFAVGDGASIAWEKKPSETVSLVYHFHKDPKGFTGGGVRLFDCAIKDGGSARAAFRDLEISDNCALVFPGEVGRAGLPVYCTSGAVTDSLFVLQGSLGVSRG
jgi:hypothetical protein